MPSPKRSAVYQLCGGGGRVGGVEREGGQQYNPFSTAIQQSSIALCAKTMSIIGMGCLLINTVASFGLLIFGRFWLVSRSSSPTKTIDLIEQLWGDKWRERFGTRKKYEMKIWGRCQVGNDIMTPNGVICPSRQTQEPYPYIQMVGTNGCTAKYTVKGNNDGINCRLDCWLGRVGK